MVNKIMITAWLESLRLKTLPLALTSIVNGSMLAYWQSQFSWGIAIFSVMTAILLQILSNLANDYGDMLKGTDTNERVGPKRGMQKGLITQKQMKSALWFVIFLIILSGSSLLLVSCDSIQDFISFLLLGCLSIIAAVTYTMGKRPYGYLGLGDISVFLFFGLLGVLGTYYLQVKSLSLYLLLPAFASGCLSVSVLNINNLRDFDTDKQNNKNTLIVRLGEKYGRYYHCLLLIMAILCFSLFSGCYLDGIGRWLFLVLCPFYIRHGKYVLCHYHSKEIAEQLVIVVRLAVLTNVLFAIGIWLTS